MSDFAYSQAIQQPRLLKKIGPFELNKALLTMGFGTWGALEPGNPIGMMIDVFLDLAKNFKIQF